VFDVSAHHLIYGWNGPLSILAGHDISLALARRQLDFVLMNNCIEGLTESESGRLMQFLREFKATYRQVARLSTPLTRQHPVVPGAITAPIAISLPKLFTLETLHTAVHNDGNQYFALKGIVFNVDSDPERFGPCGCYHSLLGHDASAAFKTCPVDVSRIDQSITDLAFHEMLRLEAVTQEFTVRFACVGVVTDGPGSRQLQVTQPTTTAVGDLHQAIDTGDIDLIRKQMAKGDLNQICTRTSLSPLHKLVELNLPELIPEMLKAGADASLRASLYDNETAVEMAYRFGHEKCIAALSSVAG